MSDSSLPPESWRPLFDRADIEFGYRPLAARAGLTHTRVHRLIRGGGTTDEAIRKVADALGVKASKVRELRGEPAVDIEPFTLSDDAGRLTDDERDVIRAMVRALLKARDTAHAVPTSKTPPPRASVQAGPAKEVGRVIDVAFPPEHDPTLPPDINEVGVAAQQGQSEGRRLREQQDRDAEELDGSGDDDS